MAKKSMIARENKRSRLVEQYKTKRVALKESIRCPNTPSEEQEAAQLTLQKLPRDSSPSRGRNRCQITGRPRGVYRKFGLGRNELRKAVMRGDVPGLSKASW